MEQPNKYKNLIELVEEIAHEDGSITYTFDMTEEISKLCGELGLKLLLYSGALNKSPEYAFELLGKEIETMIKEKIE